MCSSDLREIAEETGLAVEIIERLGEIQYEFSGGGKLISKTVHHFLMRQVGGDLTVENDPNREAVDVLVDQPVALVVEVLRLQQIRYLVDSVVVDDQRAEHRLLGLDGMRRYF